MAGPPEPDVPALRIPEDLLPRDGRFGSGPSKIRPGALARLADSGAVMGTSHRRDPVRRVVGRIRAGLRDLWDLPDGHRVILGNGGSSTFWDVVTVGLIEHRSQHVVFGEFGEKFAGAVAAAPFLEPPALRRAPTGSACSAAPDPSIDLYALVQNETSTGVLGPAAVPGRRPEEDLVVVDATSAAGAIPWDPAEVDVYYFAPQKCFASDGGLWWAVLSPVAVERAHAVAGRGGRWVPPSLDLPSFLDRSAEDETPNTPAVATLLLMADQLEWLLTGGGMGFATARTEASAAHLYGWAETSRWATPFVTEPGWRSPVVGTVDLDPGVSAPAVAAVLRANGILDTEPYRKLGRNQLRIGMYPAVDPADVQALTACIGHVVGRLDSRGTAG